MERRRRRVETCSVTRPDVHEGDAEEGAVDDWVPDPPMALDPTITQARTGSADGSNARTKSEPQLSNRCSAGEHGPSGGGPSTAGRRENEKCRRADTRLTDSKNPSVSPARDATARNVFSRTARRSTASCLPGRQTITARHRADCESFLLPSIVGRRQTPGSARLLTPPLSGAARGRNPVRRPGPFSRPVPTAAARAARRGRGAPPAARRVAADPSAPRRAGRARGSGRPRRRRGSRRRG